MTKNDTELFNDAGDVVRLLQPRQRSVEAQLSYAGGMNASAENHRELRPDQLEHLINGTVRSGWVKTRPKFRLLPTFFENEASTFLFQREVPQGWGFAGQVGRFVFAIGGNLFAVDPLGGEVLNINPPSGRPFSKFAPFVYFEQRGNALIAQDGTNPPVIIEGGEAHLANRQEHEVFAGTMMADDWGRLALVDKNRRRIYFSDHELDPNSTPLKFTELFDYYKNTRYFEVPRRLGRIVGMAFMPWLDSDTGTGPLVVFCQYGTRTYAVNEDRTLWLERDIARTILPSIGACAHGAIVATNDDLIFSDQDGRIRSLKSARQDEQTRHAHFFDRNVWPYYRNEDPYLRRWRSAVEFGHRVYTTIQPEVVALIENDSVRHRVRHRGLVVLENEVSAAYENTDERVWAGLWTGIKPSLLAKGYFSASDTSHSKEIALILAIDEDGNNRLYMITEDASTDVVSVGGTPQQRPVTMTLVPRWMEFGSTDKTKKIDEGFIRLGAFAGQLTIRARWQSDGDGVTQSWFEHRDWVDNCLRITNEDGESDSLCREATEPKDCLLENALPEQIPRLSLPSPQGKFYKGRPVLDFVGDACVQEMVFFSSNPDPAPKQSNTRCKAPEKPKQRRGCPWSPWESVDAPQAPAPTPTKEDVLCRSN